MTCQVTNVTTTELKTCSSRATQPPTKPQRPAFGDRTAQMAQLLLLIGAIFGVLWLLDGMVAR